jgi:hypothetical protein
LFVSILSLPRAISHGGSALVWAEGHYNGAIKTRKTVQPGGDDDDAEDGEEAAAGSGGGKAVARKRSRQLRELYDLLTREAAGGGGGGSTGGAPVAARRPCASLAPEDLAETEWFYLMSASYCFPPGVGYVHSLGPPLHAPSL